MGTVCQTFLLTHNYLSTNPALHNFIYAVCLLRSGAGDHNLLARRRDSSQSGTTQGLRDNLRVPGVRGRPRSSIAQNHRRNAPVSIDRFSHCENTGCVSRAERPPDLSSDPLEVRTGGAL